MGKRRRHRNKTGTIIAILCAVLIFLVIAFLLVRFLWPQEQDSGSNMGKVVDWDVNIEAEDTAGEGPGIQIPGYESMEFKAGQTEQEVNIGNPADNGCYFIITLHLDDGTRLFQSDYLKPGEGFATINLEKELSAGEYVGVIQYDCYSLEDKSPLNGASAEFKLLVK